MQIVGFPMGQLNIIDIANQNLQETQIVKSYFFFLILYVHVVNQISVYQELIPSLILLKSLTTQF